MSRISFLFVFFFKSLQYPQKKAFFSFHFIIHICFFFSNWNMWFWSFYWWLHGQMKISMNRNTIAIIELMSYMAHTWNLFKKKNQGIEYSSIIYKYVRQTHFFSCFYGIFDVHSRLVKFRKNRVDFFLKNKNKNNYFMLIYINLLKVIT